MHLHLFPALSTILLALGSGFIFGFLLRKATVSRFDVIVGQLLLRDYTVMKVIFTAIVVGGIGISWLSAVGVIPALILSKTPLLFTITGGLVFGVGMSIAGYCPGTAIAALADGSKDMFFGLFGMIFGAIAFNAVSSTLLPLMGAKDFAYQQTVATYFHLPSASVIASLAVAWIAFALLMKVVDTKHPATA